MLSGWKGFLFYHVQLAEATPGRTPKIKTYYFVQKAKHRLDVPCLPYNPLILDKLWQERHLFIFKPQGPHETAYVLPIFRLPKYLPEKNVLALARLTAVVKGESIPHSCIMYAEVNGMVENWDECVV